MDIGTKILYILQGGLSFTREKEGGNDQQESDQGRKTDEGDSLALFIKLLS